MITFISNVLYIITEEKVTEVDTKDLKALTFVW